MKTTGGKTTHKRKARAVQILYAGKVGNDDNSREPHIIAVRAAETLRVALDEYFDETLQHSGYDKPLINGNTMIVSNKAGEHRYIAREA